MNRLFTRYANLLAAGVLALLCLALYYPALGGFWREDDSAILIHLLENSLLEIFTVPAVWQALSQSNLTPWVSLSYLVDYSLFGFTPSLFYLHHLVSLFLVCFAGYILLSRYTDRRWAFLGSLLFLIGSPVAVVSTQLMSRHYVEGLLFTLLCLIFLDNYNRAQTTGSIKTQWIKLGAAAFFYLLAVTAKEIYVPLVLVIPLLVSGSLRHRFKSTTPFLAIALFYIVWRNAMLADLIGGYSASSDYFRLAFWLTAANEIGSIPALLLGRYWAPLALLYLSIITAWLLIFRKHVLLFALVAALVVLPLIPLVQIPGLTSPNRYLLLPWFVLVYSFAFCAAGLAQHWAAPAPRSLAPLVPAALVVIVLLVADNSRDQTLRRLPGLVENDVQMRFLWESGADTALVPSGSLASAYWQVMSLERIKERLHPGASFPLVIIDNSKLENIKRLFEYSGACGCMVDISDEIPQRLAALQNTRADAALEVYVKNENGLLTWRFGPYSDGEYRVISEEFGVSYMGASGERVRAQFPGEIRFHVVYESPEGWRTSSPSIHVTPDGTPVDWQRD